MNSNKLTLFDDFKSWMEGNGYKPTVSSSYVSYLRTLFGKLYSGGYSAIPNAEELLNSAVICPGLIKGLLEYFNITIKTAFDDTYGSITIKQLNNGRSAFRKFVEFMLGHVGALHYNAQNNIQPASKQAPKYIKPAKSYQNMMGWKTFTQKDIVGKMKNRLGTQDRLSGDKVWFLIRVVKELLGSAWFDNWCKSIISKTKVLVDDQGGFKMLNQVDELILKPDSNDKYSVWIVVGGQEYRVNTHTKSGIIEALMVKNMGDVSLEHTRPIDTTLKNLGSQGRLPELSKISDIVKQVSAAINNKSAAELKKHIKVDVTEVKSDNPIASVSIDLKKLIKEMDLIKDDTDYELMDGNENIRKGGSTGGTLLVPSTLSKRAPAPTVTVAKVAPIKKAHGATTVKAGMKIGQYAKQTLTDLLQSQKLTPANISDLEDPVFCKNILGINYPVLVDVTKMVPEKGRYYKSESCIAPYVICNDWYEKNRSKFDAWLETI